MAVRLTGPKHLQLSTPVNLLCLTLSNMVYLSLLNSPELYRTLPDCTVPDSIHLLLCSALCLTVGGSHPFSWFVYFWCPVMEAFLRKSTLCNTLTMYHTITSFHAQWIFHALQFNHTLPIYHTKLFESTPNYYDLPTMSTNIPCSFVHSTSRQACISNTPTASFTILQTDKCWVSLWRIMAFPHIYDVSHSKLHELGQN